MRLFFQEMIRVGEQFRDGIGRDGIVVAADLSVSIGPKSFACRAAAPGFSLLRAAAASLNPFKDKL